MRRLLALALVSMAAFAADISGTWNATVELDVGSGTPTFVLKQTGDQITGTYSGAMGEAKVKGTITGDKVEFRFDVAPDSDTVTAVYTGTLAGDKTMKGTVKIGTVGSGTFTATKK